MNLHPVLRHPVTAVAVGVVALSLAAGGGAVAAGLITSADIANHTIKGVDIKSGAVGHGAIKDGGVRGKDIHQGAVHGVNLNKVLLAKINKGGPAGPAGPAGPQGPVGPVGPAGDSHISYVTALGGIFAARAGEEAGLKMTGEGAQFGPFADGGGCDNPGTDYARLNFNGLNGQPLSAIKQLDFTGLTTSDNNTSGVGSLTMRITTDHAGTPVSDYPNNRFVFSPNTQAGPDTNADTRGQVKTYLTTLGSWRLNDDAGERPADEKPFSYWVANDGTEHITKVDIMLGCQAGTNLTGVVRSVQVNGTTYVLGS